MLINAACFKKHIHANRNNRNNVINNNNNNIICKGDMLFHAFYDTSFKTLINNGLASPTKIMKSVHVNCRHALD